MAHFLTMNPCSPLRLTCLEIPNGTRASLIRGRTSWRNLNHKNFRRKRQSLLQCFRASSSTSSSLTRDEKVGSGKETERENGEKQIEYLVCDYGWRVRRLAEKADEIRKAAKLQAEAFHVPVALFNDLFFQFFQAEVHSGLLYKLNNSPPNRYACLVAEPATNDSDSPKQVVGIVDATASRYKDVLQHLPSEAEEYLYISGIAVSRSFRRRKIATALLKACDVLSILWGFEFLALRAYEDDWGARKLYANAGYHVVSRDPPWISTWIGRKCRVLMIKRANLPLQLNPQFGRNSK